MSLQRFLIVAEDRNSGISKSASMPGVGRVIPTWLRRSCFNGLVPGLVWSLPLSCLMSILSPATSAGGPDELPVEDSEQRAFAEPAEESVTETPVLLYDAAVVTAPAAVLRQHTAGHGNCHCRHCTGHEESFWSGYKRRKQEQYWGYPEYFHEAAFGALSTDLIRPQVLRGEAARLTIYDYDFLPGTAQLNARGIRRVRQMAHMACSSGQTIVVEWMGSELDEARYQQVVAFAAAEHLPATQVVAGQPLAAGLGAEEALIHRRTGLENARRFGVRQFQFGAGAGGFSTSGFSTSGSSNSGSTSTSSN